MTEQLNNGDEAARMFAELSLALLADQGGIHPYKAKFWKAYLGEAYALWELIRLRSSHTQGWSTVQTYRIDDLAAELQVTPDTITGRWVDGELSPSWFATLYEEMIMAIEVAEHDPVTVVKVQVWHDLPILTPWQASRLNPELQAEHRAWLEENLRLYREGGLN